MLKNNNNQALKTLNSVLLPNIPKNRLSWMPEIA